MLDCRAENRPHEELLVADQNYGSLATDIDSTRRENIGGKGAFRPERVPHPTWNRDSLMDCLALILSDDYDRVVVLR